VKELIYQFKFQRLKTFAWLVTDYLARGLTEHFPHLPCIPVPASSVKSSARTNEQPGLAPGLGTMQQIGANLRKAYGCIVYDCLTSLSKAPQKALDFEGRLQNVRGRFSLKKEKTKLSGFSYPPQVVLLDDIFTTGATADECTRVLLTAGVKQVYIMTIAMD
jgi:predicted amidophosphoribosyltransferase